MESMEAELCRICHGPQSCAEDPLLSPCLCDGSVRWIHRVCLDHWRMQLAEDSRRTLGCELCGFAFVHEVRQAIRPEVLADLCQHGFGACLPYGAAAGILGCVTTKWAAAFDLFGLVLFGRAVIDVRGRLLGGDSICGVVLQRILTLRRPAPDVLGSVASATAAVEEMPWDFYVALPPQEAEEREVRQRAPVPEEGSEQPWFCCSRQCCCEACLFLSLPFALSALWHGATWLLGKDGTTLFLMAMAASGYVYWACISVALLSLSLLKPPLRAVRGNLGLPLVRSLSDDERIIAKAALARPSISECAEPGPGVA